MSRPLTAPAQLSYSTRANPQHLLSSTHPTHPTRWCSSGAGRQRLRLLRARTRSRRLCSSWSMPSSRSSSSGQCHPHLSSWLIVPMWLGCLGFCGRGGRLAVVMSGRPHERKERDQRSAASSAQRSALSSRRVDQTSNANRALQPKLTSRIDGCSAVGWIMAYQGIVDEKVKKVCVSFVRSG